MIAQAARLWAVARMTLLEAVRRKVFAVLLIFSAALLTGMVFFASVDDDSRLRVLQAWSLRAATLFSAIVGLFLAGFSIPGDVEHKRVHLLVTKPLPKASLFLGRLLGFSLLLAVFIGATGLISTSLMRVAAWAGDDVPQPVARPRIRPLLMGSVEGHQVPGIVGTAIVRDPRAMLLWRFRALRPEEFDGPIRAQIRLAAGSPLDKYRAEGRARVLVKSPAGVREVATLSLNTNEEKDFLIPLEALGGGGQLEVGVQVVDEDGYLAADPSRLSLLGRPMLFEAAYLGGMGLVFLQSLTVLALTMAASTFVSGPLAVLLGILLYLVGTVHSFMLEGTQDLQRALLETRHGGHGPEPDVKDLPPALIRFSNVVTSAVLKAVPDFDRFDYGRWLLKDTAVSWREAWTALRHALPLLLGCTILGTLVMMRRDLGG